MQEHALLKAQKALSFLSKSQRSRVLNDAQLALDAEDVAEDEVVECQSVSSAGSTATPTEVGVVVPAQQSHKSQRATIDADYAYEGQHQGETACSKKIEGGCEEESKAGKESGGSRDENALHEEKDAGVDKTKDQSSWWLHVNLTGDKEPEEPGCTENGASQPESVVHQLRAKVLQLQASVSVLEARATLAEMNAKTEAKKAQAERWRREEAEAACAIAEGKLALLLKEEQKASGKKKKDPSKGLTGKSGPSSSTTSTPSHHSLEANKEEHQIQVSSPDQASSQSDPKAPEAAMPADDVLEIKVPQKSSESVFEKLALDLD